MLRCRTEKQVENKSIRKTKSKTKLGTHNGTSKNNKCIQFTNKYQTMFDRWNLISAKILIYNNYI